VLTVVVFIVLVALIFDFINGFHDAANSIATVVSTRVLSPGQAVIWAAFFNFVAAFGFGTAVAKTMGKGMIDLSVVSNEVILAGLIGAITWNLFTWYYGLPVSSSHALIGGYAGAAVAKAGPTAILVSGWTKTLIFIVMAPLMGMFVGFLLMVAVSWIFRRWQPFKLDQLFRRLQLVSAGLYSLGHGGNDAQKTMGIITLLLITSGHLSSNAGPPWWVILLAGTAIASGTYMGGWRIIRTMGKGLADIESPQGFAAETSSTAVLLASSHLGFALSTTQVVSGGILGAGLGRKLAEVRWTLAGKMALAWCFTLPVAALVGGLSGKVADSGNGGVAIIAVIAIVMVSGIYLLSRRNAVTATNVNDATSVTLEPEAVPA